MTRDELLQNAKPILFNTEMVKAILDGRKTVTRRLIKKLPDDAEFSGWLLDSTCQEDAKDIGSAGFKTRKQKTEKAGCIFVKPPYQTGDIIYVRETWNHYKYDNLSNEYHEEGYFYKASPEMKKKLPDYVQYNWGKKWCPSIHMPKEAARIFSKVLDVRVERLQDITEEQAKAEGCNSGLLTGPCTARGQFENLWNSTIKKSDFDRYGWNANHWVWVIEFERIYPE